MHFADAFMQSELKICILSVLGIWIYDLSLHHVLLFELQQDYIKF